jgi:hypothetical protein
MGMKPQGPRRNARTTEKQSPEGTIVRIVDDPNWSSSGIPTEMSHLATALEEMTTAGKLKNSLHSRLGAQA